MADYGFYVVPVDQGKPFILMNDVMVEYCNSPKISTRSKKTKRPDQRQFFKGTLLREVVLSEEQLYQSSKILCRNPESEDYFYCNQKDLKEIAESIYMLLFAISSCQSRFEIFNDKNRLAEGRDMTIDDEVMVKMPDNAGDVRGIIRYKGEVEGKDGTQFGVELFDAEGRGNCNGTYAKQRYFQCDADCGIFLPLNRVKSLSNRNRNHSSHSATRRNKHSGHSSAGSSSRSHSSPEACPLTYGISEKELAEIPIKHESEVYIFTEVKGRESQEKGKVKFIGRLPGTNGQGVYVGIDLDRPVGNGTGLYSGKHLFYTRQNHAALVPLSGVLPVAFAEVQTSYSEHHDNHRESQDGHTSSIKKTRKNHSSPHTTRHQDRGMRFDDKTFMQSSNRTVNSSPAVLGGYDRGGSQEKFSMMMRNIPSDIYGASSARGSSDARELTEIASRHLPRAIDADDNSGDDMDIYGSESAKSGDTKNEHSNVDFRSHGRRNHPVSVPGTPPVPMATLPRRNAHTVSHYGSRNGQLAEIVPLNTIDDGFINGTDGLDINSMVQVSSAAVRSVADTGPLYGVIKWIGKLPGSESPTTTLQDTCPTVQDSEVSAGIELEKNIPNGNDGTYQGRRFFECAYGKGHFVHLKFCTKDQRFSGESFSVAATFTPLPKDFGSLESPVVKENVPPPIRLDHDMIGKKRGIQGHHNSCYLDSTLFSLFAYSQVLDTILFRPRKSDDLAQYEETQKLLKESIINPLRKHHFVRADRIMQLRQLLDKLGSTTGLVNEEKDPEEFLNTLLHQVLKAEPLHELRQGDSNAANEGFFYQIFMERDEKFVFPSTQQLLEKSLISADLKFRNVPVCLILQMPRFGKDYKMYKRLKPALQLDITDLVEDMPRTCDVCEGFAEFECRDCFMEGSMNESNYTFCNVCVERVHSHRKRKTHNYKAIKVPDEFREYVNSSSDKSDKPHVRRQVLELFAVVCIATSHYVSFAKCGYRENASWVFFDSMADRVGEQNGYNIPEITPCPDVEKWLSVDERNLLQEDEKLMPELKRRLLCDSYMCMYQNLELMVNK